jgi:hypothetical protein
MDEKKHHKVETHEARRSRLAGRLLVQYTVRGHHPLSTLSRGPTSYGRDVATLSHLRERAITTQHADTYVFLRDVSTQSVISLCFYRPAFFAM